MALAVGKLPFLTVDETMREGQLEDLVRHVLAHKGKVPLNLWKRVADFIREVVPINGFRDANDAPLPLQVKPITKHASSSNVFFDLLLKVWVTTQADLQ